MFKLAIDSGSGTERSYELGSESVSIGASSANDVVVTAPGVAPTHLVIRRSGDAYTFVSQPRQIVLLNGIRRARGVLAAGDKIRLGTTTITFSGTAEDETSDEALDPVGGDEPAPVPTPDGRPETPRAEVALFNEPERLARGRRAALELFRSAVQTDMVGGLEDYLARVFPAARTMLAWLDQKGALQPIVSTWAGPVPQLPSRTYSELAVGGRIAVLRGSRPEILIYPVPLGEGANVYLLAETDAERADEDRILLAELAVMLALNWDNVSGSSAFFGRWEQDAARRLEARLPGTSQAVVDLRQQMLAAARSASPVLLYGRPGGGRAYLASLIASLCPTGKPWIRIVQACRDDEASVRAELFGSESAVGVRGLAERAGGGVVVVRDVDALSAEMQQDLAAAVRSDSRSGFGPKVRWILTVGEAGLGLAAEGRLDEGLVKATERHAIGVPRLDERREDLPIVIVRALETVSAEQGKKVNGIALETLDSLLSHPFEGQMKELLSELRRLVTATPDGEMVKGTVGTSSLEAPLAAAVEGDAADAVSLLGRDNLKVVIPAVERILIDRVLRRSLGNQSKAARDLNLSRGALIAKIKEYGIPDYRSLRRNR